jgi:hypothetical protein
MFATKALAAKAEGEDRLLANTWSTAHRPRDDISSTSPAAAVAAVIVTIEYVISSHPGNVWKGIMWRCPWIGTAHYGKLSRRIKPSRSASGGANYRLILPSVLPICSESMLRVSDVSSLTP